MYTKSFNKFRLIFILILIIFSGSNWAREKSDHGAELSAPEKNFEYLWKCCDVNYALFNAKHIDWQALYNIYRPQVNSQTTDDELFLIMSKMLGHLNDNHVRLTTTNPKRSFGAGFLYDFFKKGYPDSLRAFLQRRPVPEKYFKNPLKESDNKIFAYGWLNDNIGYFHFNAFGQFESTTQAIDEIIHEFRDAEAIIVDVRRNGGGDDQIGKLIANRFADQKRLYMTTQERNGPQHGDFDPKRYFFVEPAGPLQFTKTVILLTNRLSISAAENFTLAMRVLPHVTVIGGFTSGCFADNYPFKLPNGWNLSLSKNLFLDYQGFCWEGIGVPPDLKISTNYDSVTVKKDEILETAIDLIKFGNLQLQNEDKSLCGTQSLVGVMAQAIETEGINPAIQQFTQTEKSDSSGKYYIDFFELLALGNKLVESKQIEQGEKIFALASQLFPENPYIYESAGMAYLKQNQKEKAVEAFKEAITIQSTKNLPPSRQFIEYLGNVIIANLLSKGADETSRQYQIFKMQYPVEVQENLLNNLGYQFLYEKLYDEAIQIFKLNVKLYPESTNVYDSLGEAYMNAGDKNLAIQNYEKSLKLNPDNRGAFEYLKKLKATKSK